MPRDGDSMAQLSASARDRLVRRAASFVHRQDYAPTLDDPGEGPARVRFGLHGWVFFVQVDPADDRFWQLGAGFRLDTPRRTELELLRAAHEAQGATRVAKVRIGPRGRWVEFTVPLVTGERAPTGERLAGGLELLRAIASEFHHRLLLQHPVAAA